MDLQMQAQMAPAKLPLDVGSWTANADSEEGPIEQDAEQPAQAGYDEEAAEAALDGQGDEQVED